MQTKIIRIHQRGYPEVLKEIGSPPKVLYCRGDMSVLDRTCLSVVGTRKNSDYGRLMTEKIVKGLAFLDICIISGLAKGIDTLAHSLALKYGLPTVAVLGSGLDNVYPSENFLLTRRILDAGGLLIAEHPDDTAPLKGHFPARNRIISGLSAATLMVESSEKSGALITARFALEQGRDVFTVPADIGRVNSGGALRLLQNGAAYPVGSATDIIDFLRTHSYLLPDKEKGYAKQVPRSIPVQGAASSKVHPILVHLSESRPISLEALLDKIDLKVPQLLAELSILEMQGMVEQKEGRYLLRKKPSLLQ